MEVLPVQVVAVLRLDNVQPWLVAVHTVYNDLQECGKRVLPELAQAVSMTEVCYFNYKSTTQTDAQKSS